MSFTDEEIARIAHEANRALQQVLGDSAIPVAPTWDQFPKDQQDGVISGVKAGRYGATPEALHEKWMAEKQAVGWEYGEVKDAEAKTHPLLVPFDQLAPGDRAKDYLFAGICVAMNKASDIKTRAENEQLAITESLAQAAKLANSNQPFGGATPIAVDVAAQPPRTKEG